MNIISLKYLVEDCNWIIYWYLFFNKNDLIHFKHFNILVLTTKISTNILLF